MIIVLRFSLKIFQQNMPQRFVLKNVPRRDWWKRANGVAVLYPDDVMTQIIISHKSFYIKAAATDG